MKNSWVKALFTMHGRCLLCEQSVWSAAQGICSYCEKSLPLLTRCSLCGFPVTNSTSLCGRCIHKPPLWNAYVTVDHYRPPLSTLLNQLKLQRRFELAPALARLLLLRWLLQRRVHSLLKPEMLLPVPLSRHRQWQRGFNQSTLLALPLARWLDVPCNEQLLRRIRHTQPQQQLPAVLRKQNLRHAFTLTRSLPVKRVALLDDVVTTGTTVSALSRLLRLGGAQEIQVWSLCRTL